MSSVRMTSAVYRGAALAVAVALIAAGVGPAHADETTARAKAAFERGRAFYGQGRYEEAAQEFEQGYALSPRPLFLVNLGQAYRQLGRLEAARDHYQRFLDQSPPDDPQRGGVERIISDIDLKIAEEKAAAKPAPEVTPAPPSPILQAQQPPKKKPFIKRFWWIIPVGAVVVTGLAVGIYFGVKSRGSSIDCTGATLGCLQ